MKIWKRKPPKPPPKNSESDWYWFMKEGETQLIASELWPGRNRFANGWWGPLIEKPTESPPK